MEMMANEMPDIVGDASRRKAGWKDKTGRWVRKGARVRGNWRHSSIMASTRYSGCFGGGHFDDFHMLVHL